MKTSNSRAWARINSFTLKLMEMLRHSRGVHESILLRSGKKTRAVDGKIDEGGDAQEKEEEEAV